MELKNTIVHQGELVSHDSSGNQTIEKIVLVITGEDENGEIQTITITENIQ